MANRRKVIITCAVTGAIHTPSMSPLPAGDAEGDRRGCDRRGGSGRGDRASARARSGRRPVRRRIPKLFREFAPEIKRRSNVVLNFTTGGAATMTIEERLQPALQLKPEVASLNMGSMNFGLFPMLQRFKEFKHRLGAPVSRDVRRADLQEHVQGHRVHPDVVRGQRHALRDRVLRHRPPLHGAALPRSRRREAAALHPERVRHPRRHRPASRGRRAHEAHRRPPVRRPVPVERARRRAQPVADRRACRRRWAATCASGWRTVCGSDPATLAESNAAQVRAAVQIIEGLGLEVATPDDAREILALKGRAEVGF